MSQYEQRANYAQTPNFLTGKSAIEPRLTLYDREIIRTLLKHCKSEGPHKISNRLLASLADISLSYFSKRDGALERLAGLGFIRERVGYLIDETGKREQTFLYVNLDKIWAMNKDEPCIPDQYLVSETMIVWRDVIVSPQDTVEEEEIPGTVSPQDTDRISTRYGTVSPQDTDRISTRYGTVSPQDTESSLKSDSNIVILSNISNIDANIAPETQKKSEKKKQKTEKPGKKPLELTIEAPVIPDLTGPATAESIIALGDYFRGFSIAADNRSTKYKRLLQEGVMPLLQRKFSLEQIYTVLLVCTRREELRIEAGKPWLRDERYLSGGYSCDVWTIPAMMDEKLTFAHKLQAAQARADRSAQDPPTRAERSAAQDEPVQVTPLHDMLPDDARVFWSTYIPEPGGKRVAINAKPAATYRYMTVGEAKTYGFTGRQLVPAHINHIEMLQRDAANKAQAEAAAISQVS
jgi:hypothetical protein